MPDEPSVLSNLGLSYVLAKDLPKAEEMLRRAYGRRGADPRVRANLALVVGLRGNLAEAEKIVKADLPPEEARRQRRAVEAVAVAEGKRARRDAARCRSRRPDAPTERRRVGAGRVSRRPSTRRVI